MASRAMFIAALGLLTPAFAAPTTIFARDTTLTCQGKSSSDPTFTFTTPGGTYDILCGSDYSGGDIGSTEVDTFEECLLACDATSGCIDVSYQGVGCYFKGTLNDLNANSGVSTARKQPTPALSCEGKGPSDPTITYTSADGIYDILCGVDYEDGNIETTTADTFEECIADCDAVSTCIDVSYVGTSCYLKSALNTLIESSGVWTATNRVRSEAAAARLSCTNDKSEGVTYQATNGKYTIVCGQEHAGGDIASTTSDTFEDCIEACDTYSGCVDVS